MKTAALVVLSALCFLAIGQELKTITRGYPVHSATITVQCAGGFVFLTPVKTSSLPTHSTPLIISKPHEVQTCSLRSILMMPKSTPLTSPSVRGTMNSIGSMYRFLLRAFHALAADLNPTVLPVVTFVSPYFTSLTQHLFLATSSTSSALSTTWPTNEGLLSSLASSGGRILHAGRQSIYRVFSIYYAGINTKLIFLVASARNVSNWGQQELAEFVHEFGQLVFIVWGSLMILAMHVTMLVLVVSNVTLTATWLLGIVRLQLEFGNLEREDVDN